jgi:D-sedoheptulose 7-phosphate isomerase
VFLEQLRTLLDAGDVVIAISASGNSPNIVKAIEYANAATPKGDYGLVEDLHLMLNHLISS